MKAACGGVINRHAVCGYYVLGLAESGIAVKAAGSFVIFVLIGVAVAVRLLASVMMVAVVLDCLFDGVGVAAAVHLPVYLRSLVARRRVAAVRHGDRAGSGYRKQGDKHNRKISFQIDHIFIIAQSGGIATVFNKIVMRFVSEISVKIHSQKK